MDTIFSQEEINTGRQREFDYLKGIFMLLIYLIHAFQATGSPESPAVQWIYMFATMSGAAIFIFVMGLGTVYSRNAAPAEFIKSGIRMIIYQYLDNIAYVAALLLPYPFVSGNLPESGMESLKMVLKIYIQYTNIFFITGIIYLVLALLKKLHTNLAGYLVIGLACSIAAPFLYGKPVDVPVLGYVTKLLIGEADFVSFTPLYFLSYALFGIVFGKILQHVKNKALFYKLLTIACIIIATIWWALVFQKYDGDTSGMWAALSIAYTTPNLWHVVASLAHILIFASFFFFGEEIQKKKQQPHDGQNTEALAQNRGRQDTPQGCEASTRNSKLPEPKNPIAKQLLYYSSHISKYYAIHVTIYFVAYGFHGYKSFQSYQCLLLTLLSMIVTECIVRGYNYLSDKILCKRNSLT